MHALIQLRMENLSNERLKELSLFSLVKKKIKDKEDIVALYEAITEVNTTARMCC